MTQSSELVHVPLQEFVQFLNKENIRKFFFVIDPQRGVVISSHPKLQPIADFLQSDTRDFAGHEGLFFQVSKRHGTLQGAFVHRTNRGQGSGGLRYWHYEKLEDFLRDGLRLSRGMTYKNALAGLWWGGGKGVIAHERAAGIHDPRVRAAIFQEFGAFVASLQGCYVTAEDVGTNVTDMANVFSRNRFITCIPQEYGGSGNPSMATARGIVCGMEAALEFAGAPALVGKTIAVQGMGNVAVALLRLLFERNVAKVIACDVDSELVERVRNVFSGRNLEGYVVSADDISILHTGCDILAPCAIGAILNPRTIPEIRAKIICGAANNQLEDPERDDHALFDRGIVYVPDFLVNRMGIVNCANEQYGYVLRDPFFERHLKRDWEYSVFQMTLSVLRASRTSQEPPGKVAVRRAEELSLVDHPIFGHRGLQIISSLVEGRWHENP